MKELGIFLALVAIICCQGIVQAYAADTPIVSVDNTTIMSGDTIVISYSGIYNGDKAQLVLSPRVSGPNDWYFYLEDMYLPFALYPAYAVMKGSNLTIICATMGTVNGDTTLCKAMHNEPFRYRIDHYIPIDMYSKAGMRGAYSGGIVNATLNVVGTKSGFDTSSGSISCKINTNMKGKFRLLVKVNDVVAMKQWITVK